MNNTRPHPVVLTGTEHGGFGTSAAIHILCLTDFARHVPGTDTIEAPSAFSTNVDCLGKNGAARQD